MILTLNLERDYFGNYEKTEIKIQHNKVDNVLNFTVEENSSKSVEFYLNKEELHDFIGTLLHLQSKMKGGK